MPVLTKINTNVIADDAVTAAKTSATAEQELSTSANIDLSGTTTGQKLHFADAFTLTGDLTVNDDLVLGKVRDDGTGQSLTGSGTTLSGTGTLTMGSYLDGEPKAGRVTSLGGSPNLNLGNATFPAGHLLKVQTFNLASDITTTNSTAFTTIFNINYTPHGGSANNSTIYPTLFCHGAAVQSSGNDGRKLINIEISGNDITNLSYAPTEEFFGCYDYGGSGITQRQYFNMELAARTLDGTGNANITYVIQMKNNAGAASISFTMQGNNTDQETHLLIREVQ